MCVCVSDPVYAMSQKVRLLINIFKPGADVLSGPKQDLEQDLLLDKEREGETERERVCERERERNREGEKE